MIICSPQLGISPESGLGGEVYDREIIKSLDKLGVITLLIIPFGKKYPKLKNAKVYFLPLPFVYPPWLFNLLVLPYLFFLYNKYKFSILRVHNPYFLGIGAVLFKKLFIEVKLNFSYLHLESQNRLPAYIDRHLLPKCDLITTISQSTKDEMAHEYKIDPKKISIVPCGVDSKYQFKEKNVQLVQKYSLENKKVLLYLGQLIERKNTAFLFEVIKNLPVEYILIICGDGPEKLSLEDIVEATNLKERVIFTGKLSESDKVNHYNLAECFVYPSLKEGFGLSVCEALSCNKTVFANNLPVFKEINSRGIVLLPLNPSLWAHEITRREGKKHSYKVNYSWDKSAQKLYDLYQQQ